MEKLRSKVGSFEGAAPQMSFEQIKEKMLAAEAERAAGAQKQAFAAVGGGQKAAASRRRTAVWMRAAAAVAVIAAAGAWLLWPRQDATDKLAEVSSQPAEEQVTVVEKALTENEAVAVAEEVAPVDEQVAVASGSDKTSGRFNAGRTSGSSSKAAGRALSHSGSNQTEAQKSGLQQTNVQSSDIHSSNAQPAASDNTVGTETSFAEASAPTQEQKDNADSGSPANDTNRTNQSLANNTVTGNAGDPFADPFADQFDEPVKPLRKQMRKLSLGASGFLASNSVGTNKDNLPKGMVMYTDEKGNVFYSSGAPTMRYHHTAPISGGVSVRYDLNSLLYLESGVRFTFLHTWITPSGASQDLLYVGIPVGAGCNIASWNNFDLYSSAYVMPSKCIWGRNNSNFPSNYTELSDIPLMWSAGASVGATYRFNSLLGIFAEPTVSYYFPNDNAPQTLYKENPWYFTLNVGLRFNLQ